MRSLLSFWRIFGFVLLLLGLSLVAVFTTRSDLAWSVGLIYLGYDTWLLSRLIAWSRSALHSSIQSSVAAVSRPTMTVLVPARNECSVLGRCLDALLGQEDPAEQIWIIDDGSTDETLLMLERRYGLQLSADRGKSQRHPNLFLWSKPSTGKAKSFNAILPDCASDLIVTIDADTIIAPGSLRAIREEFARDAHLAGGCGILEPYCNGGKWAGYFEFFQRFEYLRAFLWRLAWSRCNALVLVSGAFAAYRREVLERLGGFDAESWVEDYELLYRLHRMAGEERLPWTVRVVTGARATTDAPGSAGRFLRQRSRWFGGFLSTLFANRDMVGNPRFQGIGHRLLPIKTIDTLLPLFTAAAQISLIYLLIRGHFINGFLLAVLGGKLLFDIVMHFWAMKLYTRWLNLPCGPRLISTALAASLLEPFFFQPLRYTGALMGWAAFLFNRFNWESQRLPLAKNEEPSCPTS